MFFSKHPVAKKAKVFHVICLAKMADVFGKYKLSNTKLKKLVLGFHF